MRVGLRTICALGALLLGLGCNDEAESDGGSVDAHADLRDAGTSDLGKPVHDAHVHVDAGDAPDLDDASDLGDTGEPRDGGEAESDAHTHLDAGLGPDALLEGDGGLVEDAHVHGGGDAGLRPVRLNGVCVEICETDSDPDPNGVRDGWGWQNQASCIMPYNSLADTLPFCDTPQPWPPFGVTPSPVGQHSTSVAVLPRPPRQVVPPASNCPHQQAGLQAWDPSWLGADGVARIPAGVTALLRGNDDISATTLIRELWIPPHSALIFNDQDTTLRVGDVHVQGSLQIGSPSCRLSSHIELIFDSDEDLTDPTIRAAIYARTGLGIVVEDGALLEIFGQLYQPTWTRLAQTAPAGATTISLAEAMDWVPGQRLVVLTSAIRDYPYLDQNEVRTIRRVLGSTSLELDAPLTALHYGGPEYQVEVGLLSRSIVLRTSEAVLAQAPTFGGHVLIRDAAARVSGAELYGLGQQNFLGRYPLHFHHSGNAVGRSYLTDNSIWRSNWRCAVIHRTDKALVSRNVAFDVFGHCYYLEDGVEMGNELSFNLAGRVKIMGPTDPLSLEALNTPAQEGFTLSQSSDLANPADRAAAGFYITNGNNHVVGNAASGGFAGYSLPNLPLALDGSPERIFPLNYGTAHFDGNSAHSAGYFWDKSGCVYAGGVLRQVTGVGGQPELVYQSGRPSWPEGRFGQDFFTNTKTFLCTIGVTHWGHASTVVNLESWDNTLMAQVFGAASIQSAIVSGGTPHKPDLVFDPHMGGYQRGFQFYDTGTQTILRDVVFRNIHPHAYPGPLPSQDNCAIFTMTHSDQFTPQRMNTTAGLYFDDVDESQRICHDDRGTLSSRNFNLNDTDGSATALPGDGLPPGPRLVGSAFTNTWRTGTDCVRHPVWGLWICPLHGTQNVASVAVEPKLGVRVVMYELNGARLGENWYSPTTSFAEAQITGPSGIGWHHEFPGGVPETIEVRALQVPVDSFVLLSFTLPPGLRCSVPQAGWSAVADVASLLTSSGAAYTTDLDTCFVRIPYTNAGELVAAGLSVPNQAWRGFSATTDFSISTGCSAANPACASVVSVLPPL